MQNFLSLNEILSLREKVYFCGVMNLKLYHRKKSVSAAIAAIYLFVVLFSGFFHTHSSFFAADAVSVKKASPTTKLMGSEGKDNCFASHFSFSAALLHEHESSLKPITPVYAIALPQTPEGSLTLQALVSYSLRGPPVV